MLQQICILFLRASYLYNLLEARNLLSFLYAAIAVFSLAYWSALTEADDTSSALSSEKLYSETADTNPQKFGYSLVQHIFSSKRLNISTAGRIGMANCLGDSGAKRNSCDRFFSRNVAQRWAGKSDGNHQERKSINCKTDSSPRKAIVLKTQVL